MFTPPKTPVTIEAPLPAVPPGAPGLGEGEVHLLDRLSVLYRYRRIVITIVTLVLAAGVVQTYTTTPEYHATATLEIKQDRAMVNGMPNALDTGDDYFLQTELSKLQSRDLVHRLLKKIDLASNPEFNGRRSQQSGLMAVVASARARIMGPFRALLGGTRPAAPLGPSAPLTPDGKPAATTQTPETDEEARLIDAFTGNLHVVPVANSRLVHVTFDSSNPAFAATAANALANEYVTQNLEIKNTAYTAKLAMLADKLETAKEQLDASRESAAHYQSTVDPGQLNSSVVQARLNELMTQADDAKTKATEAEDKYTRLKSYHLDDPTTDLLKSGALSDPDIQSDGLVRSDQQQLADFAKQRNLLVAQMRAINHPSMIAVDGQITEVTKDLRAQILQMVNTAQKMSEAAKTNEGIKAAKYQNEKGLTDRNGGTTLKYEDLQTDIKRYQGFYDSLKDQQSITEIQQKSVENNVRVMDYAEKPSSPFKPIASTNLLIALAVGLGLAVVLSFGLDYLDDTIKTPEDITRKLHTPFLGLVPAVRGDKQPILSGPVPHDFGEAYRALRTSLVFTSGGESTRVLTITSAQPLEGKTTTACNLAMVLAFGGSRVLLIDADMRRPGVHKALKMNNAVGLSHLLVGQARVREAIQRTSDPNFCVMTAGRTPPNPSELLASERMRQLVANLKQGPFDWVVIDTPPVLAVTDAIILTPLADCAVFVLGAEMTRRRLAERAINMLISSRPRIIGAVLNRVNFERNKYYYSRYYGYQYKSYYGTHAGVTKPAPKKD